MSTTTRLNLDLAVFASHRPPLGVAIAARLRGFDLDRELAAGADPASSRSRAARAEWICRCDRRRMIARSLRDTARGAPCRGAGDGLIPSGAAVAAARDELEALADELARPGPANPAGVARARLLLSDGAGPLYPPERGEALATLARRALGCLAGAELERERLT